jgi:hypothetical protein
MNEGPDGVYNMQPNSLSYLSGSGVKLGEGMYYYSRSDVIWSMKRRTIVERLDFGQNCKFNPTTLSLQSETIICRRLPDWYLVSSTRWAGVK